MSPQQVRKKVNGVKGVGSSCPHTEVCALPAAHTELMASLDALSASVGLLLERHEQHADRLLTITGHLADVASRQTATSQREAEWLRQLGEITRAVSALKGGSNA